MQSKAYIQGFMDKLAEFDKAADMAAVNAAADKERKAREEASGVPRRSVHKTPQTFGETMKYVGDRALTHLGSLGRGVTSALGVAGLRAGHGALNLATWVPALADDMVFGKLMGIGEGRGLTGRWRGNLSRWVDSKVHDIRKWSDDYDYANRVGGGFNRFLNGSVADVAGGIAGWGGVGSLLRRQWLNAAFAGWGGTEALTDGRQKQLRDREAWIRTLRPADRVGIDATSTAINQEEAPTLEEYRRYHMPANAGQTSPTGYINVPYNWRHTMSGAPTQFREFGT